MAKAKGFEIEWERGQRKVCKFKGRLGHCRGVAIRNLEAEEPKEKLDCQVQAFSDNGCKGRETG